MGRERQRQTQEVPGGLRTEENGEQIHTEVTEQRGHPLVEENVAVCRQNIYNYKEMLNSQILSAPAGFCIPLKCSMLLKRF